MDAWMHGWMDGWMDGRMDGRKDGRTDGRTEGCMDAWMHGCMDAWMHGCMGAWMHGCMDAWIHGWINGWINGWIDGWIDGWMDGWRDGWMDACRIYCTYTYCIRPSIAQKFVICTCRYELAGFRLLRTSLLLLSSALRSPTRLLDEGGLGLGFRRRRMLRPWRRGSLVQEEDARPGVSCRKAVGVGAVGAMGFGNLSYAFGLTYA